MLDESTAITRFLDSSFFCKCLGLESCRCHCCQCQGWMERTDALLMMSHGVLCSGYKAENLQELCHIHASNAAAFFAVQRCT